MRSFGNYWAVLLLCAVAPAVRASQRTLDAFSAVNLCVPFAVQIAPGSGYSLEIDGDAGVHRLQSLVLVNYGHASGAQMHALARQIQADILERFGVELEMEPNLY